jgi:hypothetical protein
MMSIDYNIQGSDDGLYIITSVILMYEQDPKKSSARSRRLTNDRFVLIVVGVLFAPNAFAYLDPGTGSIIIQGLIAAIAMAGVTFRMYWHKLRSLFGSDSEHNSTSDEILEQNTNRDMER